MKAKLSDELNRMEPGDKIGIRSYDPVSKYADIARDSGKPCWANGAIAFIERGQNGYVVTGIEEDSIRMEVFKDVIDMFDLLASQAEDEF